MEQSKTCCRCKQIKPLTAFHKLKSSPDGYNYACLDCIRQKRLQNKNKRNAYNREWYKNNKERAAEYQRAHRSSDRAKARGLVLRRRARILKNGVFLVSQKQLKKLYSSPCFYCGCTGKIEADHVIPVSRGGRHSIGNLVPACRECNISKKAMFISEWLLHKKQVIN